MFWRMFKIEWKKATWNYRSLLMLVVGMILIVLNSLPNLQSFRTSYETCSRVLGKTGSNSFYKMWGHNNSIQNFFFHKLEMNELLSVPLFLSLFVAVPYAFSLVKEMKSGYCCHMLSRANAGVYLRAKCAATFVSASFLLFLYSLFSVLYAVSVMPTYAPYSLAIATTYVTQGKNLLALFVFHTVWYFVILVAFLLLNFGLIACVGLALYPLRSSLLSVFFPFMLIFFVSLADTFGILDRTGTNEYSPGIYLNQVMGGYTPISYMLGVLLGMLILVALSLFAWTRKRDHL